MCESLFYLLEASNSFDRFSRRANPAQVIQTQNTLSDDEDNMAHRPRAEHSIQSVRLCACDFAGCDKVYSGMDGANNLRRHKREKHEGKSSWPCPFQGCLLVFTRQHNLRQHWIKFHAHTPLPTSLVPSKSKGGGGMSRKKADSAHSGQSPDSPPYPSYQ